MHNLGVKDAIVCIKVNLLGTKQANTSQVQTAR